jgi:hypothetical protein
MKMFHISDNISLNSSWNKTVLGNRCRENENTHFIFNDFFFFSENNAEKRVKPEKPQITSKHVAYELQAGQARLHASERTRPGTRTQIYNIY